MLIWYEGEKAMANHEGGEWFDNGKRLDVEIAQHFV
jgi:hypothetical protein